MRGRLITVEGLDGAGKSTHLPWLQQLLEARGVRVLVTREPGGTQMGEVLRDLVLHSGPRCHPETETLLMFAARREHLERVILPALSSGTWVLCDRFSDATYAYQGGGSGVEWEKIRRLETWVQDDLQPDLTLYLDVSPEIGRSRTGAVRAPDRFEQEREAFHARVRAGYHRRVAEARGRICVIDAGVSIANVKTQLENVISNFWFA